MGKTNMTSRTTKFVTPAIVLIIAAAISLALTPTPVFAQTKKPNILKAYISSFRFHVRVFYEFIQSKKM